VRGKEESVSGVVVDEVKLTETWPGEVDPGKTTESGLDQSKREIPN
jgi:hypothetical protein